MIFTIWDLFSAYVAEAELLRAAQQGNLVGAVVALGHGANPNVKNLFEDPVLHVALHGPRPYHIVRQLLRAGADPLQADFQFGRTLAQAALCCADWRVLRLLGKLGKLEGSIPPRETFMGTAVRLGGKCIKKAVAYGGDISRRDTEGRSVLHTACGFRPCAPRISSVLEHVPLDRVDGLLNSVDTRGRTPLHYAVEIGDVDAVSLLIGYGADINVLDTSGLTPLAQMVVRAQEAEWVDDGTEEDVLYPPVLSSPLGQVLVEHVERLYAIGVYISTNNLQYLTGTFEEIQNKYAKDISNMCSYRVGGSNISAFQLFFCDDLLFLKAITNHNILNAIKGGKIQKRCNGYAQYILYRYRFMEVHLAKFKSLVGIFLERGLPIVCAERIAELSLLH